MLPQLDTTTYLSQLFWLVICFSALYFLLSYLVLPKITRVLKTREELLEEKLNKASFYREEAESLLKDYEETLTQAREEARHQYHSVIHTMMADIAQKEKEFLEKLHQRLHVAEQDLDKVRHKARADMKSIAVDLAGDILQKLTKQSYSAAKLDLIKGKT